MADEKKQEASQIRGALKGIYDGTIGFVGNAAPRLGNAGLLAKDALEGKNREEKDYFSHWLREYADNKNDPDTQTAGYMAGSLAPALVPVAGQIGAAAKGAQGIGKLAAAGKAASAIAGKAARAPITKAGAAYGGLNVALGAGERHSFDGAGADYLTGAMMAGAAGGTLPKYKFIDPTEGKGAPAPENLVQGARRAMEGEKQPKAENGQAKTAPEAPAPEALQQAADKGDVGGAYGLAPERFKMDLSRQEKGANDAFLAAGKDFVNNNFSQGEIKALSLLGVLDKASKDWTGTGKKGVEKLGDNAVEIIIQQQKAAEGEFRAAQMESSRAQAMLNKQPNSPQAIQAKKMADARLAQATSNVQVARGLGNPAALRPRLQKWADSALAGKDAFQRGEFNSADIYGAESGALRGQEESPAGVMQYLNAQRLENIPGQRGAWRVQSDLSRHGRDGTEADKAAAQDIYSYLAKRAGLSDEKTATGKARSDAEQALQGQKMQREFANLLSGFEENPAKAYIQLNAVERQALADNLAGKQTAGGRITPELAAKIAEKLAAKETPMSKAASWLGNSLSLLGAPFGLTTGAALAGKAALEAGSRVLRRNVPERGYGALKTIAPLLKENGIEINPKAAREKISGGNIKAGMSGLAAASLGGRSGGEQNPAGIENVAPEPVPAEAATTPAPTSSNAGGGERPYVPQGFEDLALQGQPAKRDNYYTGTSWGDNLAAAFSSLAGGRAEYEAGRANWRALIEQGLDSDSAAQIAQNPAAFKEEMQTRRDRERLAAAAAKAGLRSVSPAYAKQLQAETGLQSLLGDIDAQARLVYAVDKKGNPHRTFAGRAFQGALSHISFPLPEKWGEEYRRAPLAMRQALENYRIQYAAAMGGAGGRSTDAMRENVAASHVAPFQDYKAFRHWLNENMRESRQRLANAEANKYSKESLFGDGLSLPEAQNIIMEQG